MFIELVSQPNQLRRSEMFIAEKHLAPTERRSLSVHAAINIRLLRSKARNEGNTYLSFSLHQQSSGVSEASLTQCRILEQPKAIPLTIANVLRHYSMKVVVPGRVICDELVCRGLVSLILHVQRLR